MDRQYIDDHHIVARYLADQLAEAEREAFEVYYLEHPEMLREIEATARFKAGLAQLQASGDLAALMKPTPWYAQWRYLGRCSRSPSSAIAIAFYFRTPTAPLMAANLAELRGPIVHRQLACVAAPSRQCVRRGSHIAEVRAKRLR